jgi:DNA (cytosine-5)-methyltransferase 1
MTDIIAVDFFCGAGGTTKGVSNAGIKVVKGIDIDASAKETYEKNNPGSTYVTRDIRKITAKEVMDGIDRANKKLLFVGCAPCQPFSAIHKKTKIGITKVKYDKRKSLILAFAKLVEQIKPDYIFIENVPGFGDKTNPYFKEFLKRLGNAKYSVDYSIINAKDYGVPQNRRRFLLLGSLSGEIKIPEGKYGASKKPYKTVREAIFDFPSISAGKKHPAMPNHGARKLSQKNLERIKHVRSDGGSRLDFPTSLVLDCHKNHTGHNDVYGRMAWDKPAPTLTCKCTSITNGRFGHPTQNRGVSIREAAALQTFPNDYIFYANQTTATKHVGNAVPVLLAEVIGSMFVGITGV